MTVQSVMSGAKPHQSDLLLLGQYCTRSDESLIFAEANIVAVLFSSGILLCKDAHLLIS